MEKKKIEIDGRGYPCYSTMGAMLRYKKKITPEKLLPFDWEKKGGDRPRREVVSKEESKRRFLERMARSS